jgi:hypothetical protein
MLRRLLFLLCLSLAALAGRAQSQPVENIQTPQEARPFFSRIRGLFDIDLPDLDPPGTVRLIFHPHISDLVRRDYLRTDAGFRWALNDNFELSAEASTFVTHGLRSGNDGYGIGEMRYGGKYIFKEWLRPDFETSVSLNIAQPVGHPPFDLTDGHNHFSTGLIIQHHSESNPHLTTFAGPSFELITKSSVPGAFQPNQPQDNNYSLIVGGIYDMGQLKWTLSGTGTTTALVGGAPKYFFYLQPSLLWYVPKKLTFHSKTQWIIGVGAPITWGPDGTEFKVNSRVRAEITFGQVIARMRGKDK